MKKIAVYGSLREGHGNHRALLSASKKLSTEVVNIPFKMISLGGFPGLVPSEDGDNEITIETYEVDDRTYDRVEHLEGYPHFYQKATITTSQGDMEIYVLESPRYKQNATYVENGDWNSHYQKRYAEVYSH